jgi:hypothetical protein
MPTRQGGDGDHGHGRRGAPGDQPGDAVGGRPLRHALRRGAWRLGRHRLGGWQRPGHQQRAVGADQLELRAGAERQAFGRPGEVLAMQRGMHQAAEAPVRAAQRAAPAVEPLAGGVGLRDAGQVFQRAALQRDHIGPVRQVEGRRAALHRGGDEPPRRVQHLQEADLRRGLGERSEILPVRVAQRLRPVPRDEVGDAGGGELGDAQRSVGVLGQQAGGVLGLDPALRQGGGAVRQGGGGEERGRDQREARQRERQPPPGRPPARHRVSRPGHPQPFAAPAPFGI